MESEPTAQQAFALGAPPASPATAVHPPSAASTTPHLVQLTPSQAEALAELGLISNNQPFSPESAVVSPQSPAYSQQSTDMNGVGTMSSPYYAGTPGGDGGGVTGPRMVPRALNMDIDMSSFPPSPHSASGSSTGAATPGISSLRTPYYYSPAGSPAHPTHPSVQRHHPYAHPAHPPRPSIHGSQGPSSSAIPLYLAPTSAPPPNLPTSSASDIPPSVPLSSGNGVFPTAATDPVPRVQSAPAHILSLPNGGQEGEGEMDESAPGAAFGGAAAQEWDPSTGAPMMNGSTAGAGATVGEWEMEQGHSRQATLVKPEEQGFFDGSFAYGQGQPAFAPQPPPQQATPQLLPPPTSIQLADVVAAIALLRNRLPIMEAALSTSPSDPGGDEEEIWKGVEGAYSELKRIIMCRKEARRGVLSRSGTLKASSNRGYAMDLESPSTPVDNRPPTTTFLNAHAHPPLLHSQSSPDVPTMSAQATAQRAAHAQAQQQVAQAQAANQQAMQRQHAAIQHAQMQQAQIQQMQQAEAHARAEAQLQADARARAEGEARARVEAEQRARAEEEARMKAEVEAQAQARAEAEAEVARREQQDQYEKAVAQQQQQQQQAMAHQQQQQQLHMQQMQEDHYRQQQEQHMRNQQMFEAQASSNQAQAQHQAQHQAAAHAAAQQAAHFPPPSDLPITPQSQPVSLTPQAMSNPLPPHLALSTNVSPAQQPSSASPTSRTGTPFSLSQQTPLASQGTFAYDPNSDMSMGTMMQMHMGAAASFASAPSEGPAPSVLPSENGSLDQMGWGNSNNYAALQAAATGVANMGLSAQASIPSPPNATASVSSRPSRSRAASGSGYVSASGSRSRAASGSGYQSLLETRSRAASSASSVFGTFEREEEDELEEDDADQAEHEQPVKTLTMGVASSGVEPEFKSRVDPVFLEFLADLCSNLDATDAKGEPIHQTLMAKKMEKLDQSTDFRPFKFRIQAFTTAFGEKLMAAGFHESEIPIKRIRQYLWAQPCISRFNDDGKKAKSKGNHIWTIEAKKVPDKKWIFREFSRCIKGIPPSVAFIGLPWIWSPRVWDPQCSISPSETVFSSPALPPWLSWRDNVLAGEAPESAKGQTFDIEAVAVFQGNNKSPDLRMSCTIVVASPTDNNDLSAHIPFPGQIVETTQSSFTSPSHSASSLHRSPVMTQSVFPDLSKSRHNSISEQHQTAGHLLPSLMSGSLSNSLSNSAATSLASSMSSLDQHQRQADQEFHLAMARQQEEHQRQQDQHYINATLQQASNDMQLDDSLGQQQGYDSSFEAQANLHRHYTSLAAEQQPFDAASPSALSFAPAPELVQTALRQAALTPSFASHPHGMLSNPHSESGTPGGYVNEVDGRLASFVLSNQQQQQGNFTLDPSQL